MRVCLLNPGGGLGPGVERLGRLLATEHEVLVIETGGEPDGILPFAYSCPDHERSAAALARIEAAYGDDGPDYLEAPDHRGHALVPLQAARSGHRSLRETTVAVRLADSAGLRAVHDGDAPTPANRMLTDLEREVLRLAHLVLAPSEGVAATYARALGIRLDAVVVRGAPTAPLGSKPRVPRSGPLRILYAAPLQASRGALDLAEACLACAAPEWRLTICGDDTDTAPLRQSVRATIEQLAAGDERIQLFDALSRPELSRRLSEHDLLAVPARFEAWSDVALAALAAGVPVLATPVGALPEIAVPGISGWLAEGPGAEALRAALEPLIADPAEVDRLAGSPGLREHAAGLGDEGAIRSAYAGVMSRRQPAAPAARRPLVTGIVTYFGEREYVRGAVDSLLSQSYAELEVLVVDDGCFEAEDRILEELAEDPRVRVLYKLNAGEGDARNLAALLADGEYVAFLDADNALAPEFVGRAVAMLEADPELAYVTPWLRYVEDERDRGGIARIGAEGYAPLGNGVRSDLSINSDGDAIAVLRRRLLVRGGYSYAHAAALASDWELYRQLRDDGHLGAVIPTPLADYRVRNGSLTRTFEDAHAVSWDEALSRRMARRVEWTTA